MTLRSRAGICVCDQNVLERESREVTGESLNKNMNDATNKPTTPSSDGPSERASDRATDVSSLTNVASEESSQNFL